MPIGGRWYPIGPFVNWLDSDLLYRLPFTFWFWHYGLRTALMPSGIGIVALVWPVRHAADSAHIRGLRLLTPRAHHRQLNGHWIRRLYRWLRAKPPGITLGNVVIPRRLETRHILLTGAPGMGKTTIERQALRQIRERREAAIVGDPDGELTAEFYDPDRGDLILGPDARCPFWTPFLELRADQYLTDSAAMAASIIRGNARTATEIYFRDNARSLLCAMFQVIPIEERDDPTCFTRFLAQPREKIREDLEGTSAAAVIDPSATDSGGGQAIISVANTALEGFAHLPRRDQANQIWSAREWTRTREGWLFFTATSETRAAAESLQGIWLDLLIRALLARPIGRSPQVWLVIDETAAMGFQPQLKEVSRRGRKRLISLMMGAQTIGQFRDIYGPNGAIDLIGLPATKVILRIEDPEMAGWASSILGEQEVERWRISQSQSSGSSKNRRDGLGLQQQRETEKLVMASEIMALPEREGYLAIDGRRTTIKIPPLYAVENHPGFIPRIAHTLPIAPVVDTPESPRGLDMWQP